MKIRLIVVGSVKEDFYRNKIKQYEKTISNFELVEIKDESIPQNASEKIMENIKETEGKKILEKINNGDYVIALCIEGKPTTEDMLKKEMEKAKEREKSSVDFIIGGSLGLSNSVIKRANYKLSFSKMTFPHQLMRVMLLEQIHNILRDNNYL